MQKPDYEHLIGVIQANQDDLVGLEDPTYQDWFASLGQVMDILHSLQAIDTEVQYLTPCTCGSDDITLADRKLSTPGQAVGHRSYYKCNSCKRESRPASSVSEAREHWNRKYWWRS